MLSRVCPTIGQLMEHIQTEHWLSCVYRLLQHAREFIPVYRLGDEAVHSRVDR
jgi:hypothetical protein